jgi:anti-sigma regulatory factor (Ser/Thr protein kinase)
MALRSRPAVAAFRHEALLYDGDAGFLDGTVPFLREAVAAGEPTLVVVGAAKLDRLRRELGGDADRVLFADMAQVGANPARIIPAWRQFVAENAGRDRPVRGIGEPIWRGRSPVELVECQRHEQLLNVAFAGAPAWWLLCPYDVAALDRAVIEEACRSHPWVTSAGTRGASASYRGLEAEARPFDAPLPQPPGSPAVHSFGAVAGNLAGLRRFVAEQAAAAGLGEAQRGELVLAVHEVAVNSLRHGGGRGELRVWQDGDVLVCEVRDQGRLDDPLAGRRSPTPQQHGGRGLWLANQLCDLVQLRSSADGTVARLHLRRR